MEISIVGGGSWATAIANLLSDKDDVLIFARDRDVVESINNDHCNSKYFPEVQLNKNVKASNDIKDVFRNKYIINAVSLIAMLVVYKHKDNIKRLRLGEEKKIF